MRVLPLDTSMSVVLDGSGNGTAKLAPSFGQRWDITSTTVSTVSQVPPIPRCSVYAGAAIGPTWLLDATFTGNGDQTDTPATLYFGQSVNAVWSSGKAGDTATVRVQGTVTTGYRQGA